jgi:hypothetical protein
MRPTDATTKSAVKVGILIFISVSLLILNVSTECYSGVSSDFGERYLDAAISASDRSVWHKNRRRPD